MMEGMTFPTINPHGLFGKPFPDGRPGIGTFLHSSIEEFHASQRRKGRADVMNAWDSAHTRATQRLLKELYHRTKHPTSSRDRTSSKRKRAGSKKGNGGYSSLRDKGWEVDWDRCPWTPACYMHDHNY